MTAPPMILSWCPGSGCDPCHQVVEPGPGVPPEPPPEITVPPYTTAYVIINEIEIVTAPPPPYGLPHQQPATYVLGSMTIWTAGSGTDQGAFAPPMNFGYVWSTLYDTYVPTAGSATVVFDSTLTVVFPPGTPDQSLPEITTGPLEMAVSPTDPNATVKNNGAAAANLAAASAAQNAAIAQANKALGNTPPKP